MVLVAGVCNMKWIMCVCSLLPLSMSWSWEERKPLKTCWGRTTTITFWLRCLEGQQPDCLNSPSSQVAIAPKIEVKNQKFDSEERGYFGVTKKKVPKIYCLNSSDCLNSIVWIAHPEPLVESWGLKIIPNESLWCACCRATVKTAIWALWKNCLNSFWLDQLSE